MFRFPASSSSLRRIQSAADSLPSSLPIHGDLLPSLPCSLLLPSGGVDYRNLVLFFVILSFLAFLYLCVFLCACVFVFALFFAFAQRAINTLWSILEKTDLMWIPVIRTWRLNERHYGALQVCRSFKKMT